MFALEVKLNGSRLCIAGGDDFKSLVACFAVEGQLGEHTVLEGDKAALKGIIKPTLLISGGTARRGFRWTRDVHVKTGDTVEIRLIQVAPDAADTPDPELARDPKMAADFERQVFETAKERYLKLRDKYESSGR